MTVALPVKAIDPARVGLSKSLMTNPCERRGWYSEHVRDAQGRRLSFPMPERVHFGSAVDTAHLELVYAAANGKEPDVALAIEKGMERIKGVNSSQPIDLTVFEVQLRNAMTLFVRDEVNGLARIPLDGIRFQGANGQSLKSDDIIGTPDYLLGDGSVMDVKTAARRYSLTKFFRSAEMPIYSLLAAAEAGLIPPRLIYQIYVRAARPFWEWMEVPGTAALVALGKQHAAHWRKVIALDVDALSFDPTFCGDCPFAQAIPDVGFNGCSVGLLMPHDDQLEEAA